MLVTEQSYNNIMSYIDKASVVYSDLETTGLRPYHGDRLCGIALQVSKDAFYFPFRHGEGENLPLSYLRDFQYLLTKPNVTYVGWNYKFDMQMLRVDGIDYPKKIRSVDLGFHLLDENRKNYKLKETADEFLGEDSSDEEWKLEEKLKAMGYKDPKGNMWRLSGAEVEPYACQDVRITKGLDELTIPALKEWSLYDIYEECNDYAIVTARMEERGIKVDRERIHKYVKEANEMVQPTKEKIWAMAGYELNPNSPKQVGAFLGFMNGESTGKEELQALVEDNPEDKEFIKKAQAVLDYRGWTKVNSTYYNSYLQKLTDDDVLHPELLLTGTISGRLSCISPNLQNVPKKSNVYKVKHVFVAREGYELWSCDYSQAEMRLGSHYAERLVKEIRQAHKKKVKELRKKLKTEGLNSNEKKQFDYSKSMVKKLDIQLEKSMGYILTHNFDMHTATAENLGIPRPAAKTINFGINYGMGAELLSKKLRCTLKEAEDHLLKYHTAYPGLKLLYQHEMQRAEMHQPGESAYTRLWTGRVMHYGPGVASKKAMPRLIQGGVAEVVRTAILRLAKHLEGTDIHMLLQVHDQIIFEIPVGLGEKAMPKIVEIMEDYNFDVPLKVDVSRGFRWGTLKEWKLPDRIAA